MSIQFGKCNLDGKPVEPQEFARVRSMLAESGPDGESFFCKDNLGIVYRAFHTATECRLEAQPYVTASGNVVIWDGRLDNREILIQQVAGQISADSDDVLIVAAAYETWGTGAFAKLKGDWALSIWDARKRGLVLVKDFIGARHLYYSVDKDEITFSTILDPLILFASRSLTIDEEYIAGWLSFFPAPHLTPYVGIHSVPPSSYVDLARGKENATKYWDFNPGRKILYATDVEYEEQFRVEFGESVRRRLRSDRPVLAELSGGMDSSSIVCMADRLIARGHAETPRLDTISYYNDTEPNWNERPYFAKVEEKRGRTGCHIDISAENPFTLDFHGNHLLPTPGSRLTFSEAEEQLAEYMRLCGSRVVLSGIGGDEVTGGVPTPTPELANLLATAQFKRLAHQLRLWALNKRRPWIHLLLETAQTFLPLSLVHVPKERRPASWLRGDFASREKVALLGYEVRTKLFGPPPSFQENIATLNALRRQLACDALPLGLPYEKRYPFLDRDFLEFLFAIPREQLVLPGKRRSLMRRALIGIVPDELLNRRRKAFVARSPRTGIASTWAELVKTGGEMATVSMGIADAGHLFDAASRAEHDQDVPIITLARTLTLEAWLRSLRSQTAQSPIRSVDPSLGHQWSPQDAGSFAQRDSVHMD